MGFLNGGGVSLWRVSGAEPGGRCRGYQRLGEPARVGFNGLPRIYGRLSLVSPGLIGPLVPRSIPRPALHHQES